MKFRERCEAKDKEAMEKKQEVLKEAREELTKWSDERQKKLAAKAEMNRQEEEKLIEGNKEDMKCENPWERVSKLVEMNAEREHDLSRMKQVMIRMKNDAGKDQISLFASLFVFQSFLSKWIHQQDPLRGKYLLTIFHLFVNNSHTVCFSFCNYSDPTQSKKRRIENESLVEKTVLDPFVAPSPYKYRDKFSTPCRSCFINSYLL